jgi:eukaryotic-like serine/threonine-protein kinase
VALDGRSAPPCETRWQRWLFGSDVVGDRVTRESARSGLTGRRIGTYEVGPLLAAGGMGEVYRAHDARLDRDVALKILPAGFTGDAERLARFEREARVLARLNHPGIASIHGIEEAGDVRALVLELVEGETLSALLARGVLPVHRCLEIGVALADAVAAAHEQGVTHRDLKPSNVMVRPDGRIKVLDFGIAKLRDTARSDGDTTLTALTGGGLIFGTAGYMSPEQAEGRYVDHRSDIFSLGAVLYEVATGARAFRGETLLAQVAAVLADSPTAPTELRRELPSGLDSILAHALEKDPDQRYATAHQLREDLEALRIAVGRGPMVRPLRRSLVAAGIVGAVALSVTAALVVRRAGDGRPGPAAVSDARQLTFDQGVEATPSLSPDGRLVAYERAGDIFIRPVAGGPAVNLTPDSPEHDGEPAFSPDGRSIAFSSRRDGGELHGGIWVVDVAGGPARRLSNAGFSPAWSPDGRELLYATEHVRGSDRPTNRVRVSGLHLVDSWGVTRPVGSLDVVQPAWSPGGHRIAFWRGFVPGQFPGRFNVWTMRPDGTDVVAVTDDDYLVWGPAWSPDGRYVYYISLRGGSAGVWRVPIDERSGRVLGEPQPVPVPAGMVHHVSLASNGALAWEASQDEANVYRVAFDARREVVSSAPVAVTTGTRLWESIDVSVNGRLVIGTLGPLSKLFVTGVAGAAPTPLLDSWGRDGRWSPDGDRVVFTAPIDATLETFTVRADGSGLRRISHFRDTGAGFFPLWSPDGSRLAITTGTNTGGETFLVDPARPWLDQTLETLRRPRGDPALRYRPWSWAPDGRRIAAYSERGAGIAVYSFEDGSWEIITESGTKPRFLGDSRRLLFEDEGKLWIVDVTSKRVREIFASSDATVKAPALAPGDTAIYFIRGRIERDVWLATVR